MEPNAGAPHLLAGAYAADRRVVARPSAAPRWFEPMHVREPVRVREEMAAQVVAGADFLVAPTWLTYRRALVPVGETRRVREWTELAVDVARGGAEIGRERRDGAHVARILGVLPDPDSVDEHASGRIPTPDAAAERDERDQAGVLADCGVAGVLIESRLSIERARAAVRAVVETDLPAWIVIPWTRADGSSLDAWAEALTAEGAAMLLLEAAADAGGDVTPSEAPTEMRFGMMATGPLRVPDPRGVARGWLDLGAQVLGVATDATPQALRPLAEARDAVLATAGEHRAATQAATDAWIARAVRRAARGRALWIGDQPEPLPPGFHWTVESDAMLGALPAGTWRLVISLLTLDPRDGARLVEQGGIICGLAEDADSLPGRARAAGIRLDDLAPGPDGTVRYIARRED